MSLFHPPVEPSLVLGAQFALYVGDRVRLDFGNVTVAAENESRITQFDLFTPLIHLHGPAPARARSFGCCPAFHCRIVLQDTPS
jgi:hypothetical protein